MLLVGEGDDLEPPDSFLKKKPKSDVLNLVGDYRFLTVGYFVSLHAEENGCKVFPQTKDALDIYRAAVFIERLKKSGIKVPEFKIIYKPEPETCVLAPMNPFSKNSVKIVKNDYQYIKAFKKIGIGKYPVVQLKADKVEEVKIFLNKADKTEFDWLARAIFKEFGVPLGKVLIADDYKPFYFMPIEKKEIRLDLIFEELKNENRLFC
ncbi:MAG: RimK-like ATPgrasp N-terminal domain-containing protein [Archaeoglobaceae archaeon]|nr:RimK-like ATPgrasp N-terminal domain-containing protein [Archaeoglobaceae archaeon]MCX8151474.1 RimK-like ATPgrasp N-terminal domain-containing protein [Archaeoglobaceae archaeon]MDW8014236.1 RimK-like ATPgrasp N-terminal domain-containing protein [Archaeoglobaceae archaeon]